MTSRAEQIVVRIAYHTAQIGKLMKKLEKVADIDPNGLKRIEQAMDNLVTTLKEVIGAEE